MEMYDKSNPMVISAVFNTREHVHSRSVFWNRSFRAFKEPLFSESITSESYKADRFFQNRKIFAQIAKMEAKSKKMFPIFEIKAFKHVAEVWFI